MNLVQLRAERDNSFAMAIEHWRNTDDPSIHNGIALGGGRTATGGWQPGDDPLYWLPPIDSFEVWGPGYFNMQTKDSYRQQYQCLEATAKDFLHHMRHKLGASPSSAVKAELRAAQYWVRTQEHGIVSVNDAKGAHSPAKGPWPKGRVIVDFRGGEWTLKVRFPLLDGSSTKNQVHVQGMWTDMVGHPIFRYDDNGRWLVCENNAAVVKVERGADH